MTSEEQQWHWAEGNKYALEGMKTLLLLNGGAAVSLLTFFGNRARMLSAVSSDAIGYALIFFSIETIGSFVVFISAYMTQLQYGNMGVGPQARPAFVWHKVAYTAVAIGLGGFIVGIWFARKSVVAALI